MAEANELLGYLKGHHIKQQKVAQIIGRSLSTTNRKINNKSDFTKSEIKKLHETLNIPFDILL